MVFGKLVEGMVCDFGLKYCNVDNCVFEVMLLGIGFDEFGILIYVDVVFVKVEEWVFGDGIKFDLFKVMCVGNLLYGCGMIDDKGFIVVVMYVMKMVKDSGVLFVCMICLMIEIIEEIGGDGMKYYCEYM